ncbi:hypothetical protein [Bacillus safensis]|uniref:hypothetical protein n=1 Tax=Bacillus safensis TaxID=561879 RepID=UPI003834F965
MKLMCTPSKISKARAKLEHIDNQDRKEAYMYDAGMVAVLKFVAVKEFYETIETSEIEWSESSKETQNTANGLYKNWKGFSLIQMIF